MPMSASLRAISEPWSGRSMRRAMSASRRSRFCTALEATISIAISGSMRWNSATSGGSSQVATTWLAAMRTVPRVASRPRVTLRASASAAACIRRAAGSTSSPAAVARTPRPVRSNSATPSCASSSDRWREIVG